MTSHNRLSKPREGEKRIDGSALAEIIESDEFYTLQRISEGSDIFYFLELGDCVKGYLISRQTLVLYNRKQVVYKMKAQEIRQYGKDIPIEDEQLIEFPGLKYLRRVIDRNELIGSLVRIVYIGRQKTGFGHSAKVFDVFKDVGVTSRKEIYQDGSKRKYKKRAGKKPAGRRAGRDAARVTAKV